MKTFSYTGFRDSGQSARGLVEALDPKEARERLAARGILVEHLESAEQGAGLRRRVGLGLRQRALIYRELAAMLGAGLPIDRAFDLVLATPELAGLETSIAGVRDALREGVSLADALQRSGVRVKPYELSIIESGECTGALDVVLERLADFLEEEEAMEERVRTALLYPAFVLVLALVVVALLVVVLLPNFQQLLGELRMDLPPLTRGLLGFGRVVSLAGLPLLLLCVGGGWLLRRRLRAPGPLRMAWHERMLRLPLFGAAFVALCNLRFARTLSLLLRGGVPLAEALPLAGRATGNDAVAGRVASETEQVRQGRPLSAVLQHMGPLHHTLPGWVKAGEESGRLPDMLDAAAGRYQRSWDKRITRVLALLEPLLILFVGLFVLIIAMAVLQPILSMNKGLLPQ